MLTGDGGERSRHQAGGSHVVPAKDAIEGHLWRWRWRWRWKEGVADWLHFLFFARGAISDLWFFLIIDSFFFNLLDLECYSLFLDTVQDTYNNKKPSNKKGRLRFAGKVRNSSVIILKLVLNAPSQIRNRATRKTSKKPSNKKGRLRYAGKIINSGDIILKFMWNAPSQIWNRSTRLIKKRSIRKTGWDLQEHRKFKIHYTENCVEHTLSNKKSSLDQLSCCLLHKGKCAPIGKMLSLRQVPVTI